MRIGAGLAQPVLMHPFRRGAVAAVAAGLEPRGAGGARPPYQGRPGGENRRVPEGPPLPNTPPPRAPLIKAAKALNSGVSGRRRHFKTPTRRGRAASVNGDSHTPANSETTTLVSVSATTTSAGSPAVNCIEPSPASCRSTGAGRFDSRNAISWSKRSGASTCQMLHAIARDDFARRRHRLDRPSLRADELIVGSDDARGDAADLPGPDGPTIDRQHRHHFGARP